MKRICCTILLAICGLFCNAQVLTAEQRRQIDECELQVGNLESAIEMAEADYKEALDELRAGLFCSDCKRTKSAIEREEKTSFEKHIAEGGPNRKIIQAPQSAYDLAKSKYKNKVDGYNSRLKSQKDQCARLDQRFKDEAKRKKEKEEQDKINAQNKQNQDIANKQAEAKKNADDARKKQEALDAENARRLWERQQELEQQRLENIQNLKSNIAGGMASFNSDARDNANQKVQKLARDKDWIEQNNVGTNNQLQQQQYAKQRAQNQINDLQRQSGNMYGKIQSQNNSTMQQMQNKGRSIAQNSYQRYQEAKSWLNDWRMKANEVCNGNCFLVPGKVKSYTVKELKGITQDYLKLVTWPVSSPFELYKVNDELISGVTNALEDGEKMDAVIDQFKKSFGRMLPYGSTAERLKKYGFVD